MRPSDTREDGSVLIIALIFVAVMGLVVGALVEMASTNFRNTAGTRTQRRVAYSADAAVQEAIKTYREGFAASGADTCDTTPPVVNTKPMTIGCSDPSYGTSGGFLNQPPLAVITLPPPSETGLATGSSGTLNVSGGLYSDTDINASSGSTIRVIQGPTIARTGCNGGGTFVRDPGFNCNHVGAYPDGTDPLFLPAVSSAPPPVTLPSSCPGSAPVIMPAGTYSDATALNQLFNLCSGHVFYFPPTLGGAVYYFDFTDSGPHNWTPGAVIIGGTLPAGQSLSTVTSLPSGERCDPGKSGVQFIFGGNSRLTLASASVDLCAQPDPTHTQQEIAVYGLSAGSYPPASGFRRQSGCVSNVGPGPSCSLLTMTGGGSFFSVAGTVYAPLARFDVQMTSDATRVFGRGIIARSILVSITGSSTCGSCNPFSLPPPASPVQTATVVFEASVSSDSNERLRALVTFFRDGAAPSIQSWSVVNEL